MGLVFPDLLFSASYLNDILLIKADDPLCCQRITFWIKLTKEILTIVDRTGLGKTLDDKVRLSLAIGLLVEKSVSLARAAGLANPLLPLWSSFNQSRFRGWSTRRSII